mmetsp:Transcript_32087/g.88657  ORF Transcript_32087/g.88657 Transcript_32087/m.88657 type:complete len:444 (+) Transcript_32087:45-1376(+)
MASHTLFTDPGNFRAFKVLIAAEYNGIDISIPDFTVGVDNVTPEFLRKSPLGRVPVLDTPKGPIFESNSIARYVARLRADSELCGSSFYDSAQVDTWMDFCTHDIELPATLWYYPFLGIAPYNALITAKAKADLGKALAILEAHLLDKTFIVGHHITLADIAVASALVYPFKFVAEPSYRAAYPSVMRWFTTCVNQPQFEAVIGKVVLCEKELLLPGEGQVKAAKGAIAFGGGAKDNKKKDKKQKGDQKPKQDKPKAEKKQKEEKPKAAEPDEAPKPAPKPEHPFKIMDREKPSPFSMDTWKKTYSNCDDYKKAMEEFWNMFDAEGWSIFRGDYKYNEENKMLFMTSNLIGGFIQRTEEIRKWLFGTCTIRGKEGGLMKVTDFFLIRGDSIQPLISCNDDAEYYTWTKIATPVSDADKQLIFDYWCSEGPLEGEDCLDSRCYK